MGRNLHSVVLKTICYALMIIHIWLALVSLSQCQGNNIPPEISNFFEPKYYIPWNNSETKVIRCAARNGDIKYQWRKDGIAIKNSREVSVDPKLGTIKFTRVVKYTDFGKYQCFASNEFGTAVSSAFELQEARMGYFPGTQTVGIDCTEHQDCVILCQARPFCNPPAQCRIEWKLGSGTKQNVQLNKRVVVDGDGNLHFLHATKEDGNGKEYGCGLWNEEIKTLTKGSITILNITPASQKNIEPKGVYNSKYVKATKGQNATLMCIFSGNPIPDIIWKGPQLDTLTIGRKYDIQDFGRKLVIQNVSHSDEGPYTCVANGKRQMRPMLNVTSLAKALDINLDLSVTVTLYVSSLYLLSRTETSTANILHVYYGPIAPPYFNPNSRFPQMSNTYVSAGKNAVFVCDTISMQGEDSPSKPKWMKNGKDIPASQVGPRSKYMYSPDLKQLTVYKVQKPSNGDPGDTGSFQCMTENSEGVLFKDAFLSVVDPINVFLQPQKRYIMNPKDVVVLSVDATTDPTLLLRYRWNFTDLHNVTTTVKNNNYWALSFNSKNLTIDTRGIDSDKDFFKVVGKYTAEVYHDYDAEYVYVEIGTDLNPISPQEPPATANLWFLGIIFGVLILIIVIILIICMIYRNNCKSGTYPVDEKEVAAGHDPEKELADSGFHDLSRADDDGHKYDNISLSDDFDKQIESDEDSMGEYGGDLDISKFNEDGSFIGIYTEKSDKKVKNSLPVQSTV